MALRQGQREVRIEETVVRQLVGAIHSDEKIVGVSMPYAEPPVVVFLVEKVEDAKEGS